MKIEDLKKSIENKTELSNLLLFNCKASGADFIFHQYINKFAEDNSYEIRFIESFLEISSSSLFDVKEDNNIIYIYETDKLESVPTTDCIVWVKCSKSIPKKLHEEYDDIIINVPKIEDWQIKDYINYNAPNISDECRDRLYNHYKNNLFRLELELSKIKLFSDNSELIENQLFTDSSEYNIFDLSNSIIRRDRNALNRLKDSIQFIDVDPFGLLKVLLTNFRHVIDIQLAKNPTPEYVGVNSKQFWAIKNYSCGYYSQEELVYIYQMLLTVDSKIKNGELPVDIVIDYIICKILML